jgi:phenylacetate-CoA ligase
MRQRIEESAGIKAYDVYGLPEAIGPGMAVECRHQSGLHVFEDHFYPEIIDPETGTPAPPGAPGELVITTLSTVAFPLVRFRSGDRTSLIQEPCACGRTLARLGEITGRTDPIFSVGGIKVHPDQISLLLQEVMQGALPRYRHRVVTETGLEVLEIDLIVAESFFSDEIKALETLCRQARRHLQENLGINARITLKE